MKQVLLFGSGLLLLAVAIGFYMRPSSSSSTTSIKSTSTSSMFMLYRINGKVFYKKEGDNNFSVISGEKIQLPTKTTVKTSDGKAYVLFEDSSVVTLKENTEITVRVDDKSISIIQMFGMTYHRVETLLTGKTYEVRTPTTLAAVRGTKFGVSYDPAKKETKIAVTESKVAVKDIEDMMSTSTIPQEEFTLVGIGDTATINSAENAGPKDRPVTLTKTENEPDMKKLVYDEAAIDEVFESMKESYDKEEFKRQIEKVMSKEGGKKEAEEKKLPNEESASPKKEEMKEEQKSPVIKDVPNEETRAQTDIIKKIDEEVFFSKFEPLFIQLFYVDDQMTPCSFKGEPEDRVKQIATLAKESGYPLTSTTNLSAFAKDIAEYCSTKKESTRSTLQKRFDEEYPYRQ